LTIRNVANVFKIGDLSMAKILAIVNLGQESFTTLKKYILLK
jgi:hypothetical protein